VINFFDHKRRSGLDRRTGEDRRQVISLDYFSDNPVERRKAKDRRVKGEMRDGWVRANTWSSVSKNIHPREYDHTRAVF